MVNPVISYVIPAYNSERTLADSVLSIKDSHEEIMRQKGTPSRWGEMEVLIINDGSNDATDKIGKALAGNYPNVRYFEKEHQGKGAARNFGNRMAQSDVIAVLDSDDLCIGDRTFITLKTLKQNLNKRIFYACFIAHHLDLNHDEIKQAKPIDQEKLSQTGQFGICHSTVAYYKDDILAHPYSEDPKHDDWWMLWQFFSHGLEFCYSEKPLCLYRVTAENKEKAMDVKKIESILEKKRRIMDSYFKKKVAA